MSLADYGLITDIKPIGGWRYPQAHTGGFTILEPSHSRLDRRNHDAIRLVEAVRSFRVAHNLEMGDPEDDIATFIKRVSPHNDRFKGRNIGQARTKPLIPIIKKIREWMQKLSPKQPDLILATEATERAQICLKCPQNIKWRVDACGECNKAVEYEGNCLRTVTDYPYDGALMACRLHETYLPAAIFIDRDFLEAKHPEAPANCWMPEK